MTRTIGLVRQVVEDYARFAGWRGVHALALMACATVLEGAGLVLLAPLVAVVTQAGGRWGALVQRLFQAMGVRIPVVQLEWLLAAYALLVLARAAVGLRRDCVLNRLQVEFSARLRMELIGRLVAARWEDLARLQHARVVQAINNDTPRIYGLAATLAQLVVAVCTLTAAFSAALVLAPALALVGAPFLVVLGAGAWVSTRGAGASGKASNAASRRMLHDATQFLGALKFAFSQDLAQRFAADQAQVIAAMNAAQLGFLRRQSLGRTAAVAFSALAAGAVVLAGFGAFHLGAPVLLALVAALSRMTGPALSAQQALQQLLFTLPAYESFRSLCDDLDHDRPALAIAPDATITDATVAFHRVSYRHRGPAGEPGGGVSDLSFEVRPGEFVALAGPSGVGKTTTADLLIGLLSPDRGEIRVGGRELGPHTMSAWRRHTAYVPQDPVLYHDTVRANLLSGAPEANPALLSRALAASGADAVVARLPAGLDTLVGERGTLLSGGERQRLALARALLRDPRMIVLDEATSAIDLVGEREIFERLRLLTPRPALLVVSHRNETRQLCDRTVVLSTENRSAPLSVVAP